MKHYILKQLSKFLTNYNLIKHIKRVDNNTIKIEFNDRNTYYFNLSKGDSSIYKKESNDNIKKDFNAPFDVILNKRFTNSKLEKVYLLNDDKILRFEVHSRSAYKTQLTYLQLEFTGKNTNIIILDENEIILEALRHIDEWSSIRVVKVGQKLDKLQKPDFIYEQNSVEDIDRFLYEVYEKKQTHILKNIKKEKITQLNKQIKKISKIINNLDDLETLEKKSISYNQEASAILSTLHNDTGYTKSVNLKKSNDLFKQSKKAKQKVKNQYIEQLNLSQKLEFLNRMVTIIESCKDTNEIEFYLPKKDKNQTKTKKANPYQSFFIDGYKIMLGRDERENIYLLQNSRASDFWFHLQGQVSSHVIVSNTKKSLPPYIIEEAAKICAKFSLSSGGVYSVDFTQRRNVKIQTRANVLYNPYSTIVVKI
ncbi:MAG: NFACT RNA binding domain-containing protein [Campylobacterota bacterium]|nr:NFACT RNA binding domain-containing protein [Campylobacterota bacterium]